MDDPDADPDFHPQENEARRKRVPENDTTTKKQRKKAKASTEELKAKYPIRWRC
jgi:hypothetical protein